MNFRLPRKIDETLNYASPFLDEIGGTRVYLTPRAVARRVPGLSIRELARRRSLGLSPAHELIAGCIMYAEDEIDCFAFDVANDNAIGSEVQ